MAIPGNFLSSTTEMVDPDTSGWQAVTNCSISLGTGGRNGDGCLKMTATAAGEMQAQTVSAYPVSAGTTYFTFADASSTTQPERIGIQWLDDTLAQVGSIVWSLTTAAASSSWHRISVAGTAPVGATHARVILSATAPAASDLQYFENVYLGLPFRTSGNLFTFNVESGGEIDASGWTADVNATIGRAAPAVSWSSTWYYAGGEVITMTATAAGNASMRSAETPAVEPGREYLAYCYLNPPTSSASCWVELRWLDSGGAQISAVRATLAQPGTGWYRQRVSGVAPANAASCTLAAGITSATAGQVLSLEGAVVGLAAPLVPGSVVPYVDASFEQGVGSWTVSSGVATVARSSPWGSQGYDGSYSLTATSSTATASVLTTAQYPVTPGANWRVQVAARVTAGGWTMALDSVWYDSTGTEISASSGTAVTVPSSGWWVVYDDHTAPSSAATAQIRVTLTATAASSTLQLDSAALLQALPMFETGPDDDLGRVVLVLRQLDTSQTMTLYRLVQGAQAVVRGDTGFLDAAALTSSQLTVEDYEAPLGVPVSYRAEFYDSSQNYAGERISDPVTVTVPDPSLCWIKDVTQPQRNIRLTASVAPDWKRPIEQAEYRIRGRRNSVILSDVRGGLTGELQVRTLTDAERTGLHFALDTGNTLLLQFSPGLGIDDTYVAVGDATEARIHGYGGEPRRLWTLSLTQQDAPIGGSAGTAGWTVQDVVATWGTVLDVVHSYATVLDLVLDQREA